MENVACMFDGNRSPRYNCASTLLCLNVCGGAPLGCVIGVFWERFTGWGGGTNFGKTGFPLVISFPPPRLLFFLPLSPVLGFGFHNYKVPVAITRQATGEGRLYSHPLFCEVEDEILKTRREEDKKEKNSILTCSVCCSLSTG